MNDFSCKCDFKKNLTPFWPLNSIKTSYLNGRSSHIRSFKYRMSHRYWANFWVHKRVRVPKYGSRFPSTGPILGIYLGPGSRVRVQVPEYGIWKKKWKSPTFLKCQKMILIFYIHLQDWCWSIFHVPWVIRFETGLRNIDFCRWY